MATKTVLTLVMANGQRWQLPDGKTYSGKTTWKIPQNQGPVVPVVSIEGRQVRT